MTKTSELIGKSITKIMIGELSNNFHEYYILLSDGNKIYFSDSNCPFFDIEGRYIEEDIRSDAIEMSEAIFK